MINLTDRAKVKLLEFAEAEGMKPIVRIKIIGGGCASFTNDMSFDEDIQELDEVFNFDDVKVVVDCLSVYYLDGVVVDFIESAVLGGAFKFNFPNQEKRSCGCGNSFGY